MMTVQILSEIYQTFGSHRVHISHGQNLHQLCLLILRHGRSSEFHPIKQHNLIILSCIICLDFFKTWKKVVFKTLE